MVSLSLPQSAFWAPFFAGRIPLFIKIINGLLIIWLAWQLAGLSWLLVPSASREEVADAAADLQPVQRRPVTASEKELASWHLFGEAGKQPVAKKATPLSAPETRLRLTLKGVFASSEQAMGRAIIADPKGKEDTYGIGDPLPGGAKLSEIYPDRIILERNGQFETLKLPEKRGLPKAQPPVRRSGSGVGGNSSGNRATAFNKYRNEIRQNPASFLNYVRATPARQNGKFIGFRLQPGKQRGALKDLGLKPGDIVTSINGVQIDAPAKGMKAMQALSEGDSVNVTLQRAGQEVSLNLTLPASAR